MRPDVLIVGLGPAGTSAAAAAAAAGCSVLAVDKRREIGSPVQCAEFVSALLDLPPGTADALSIQPIARMVTTVETEAPDVRTDFRGRMISRRAFDRALAARAVASGARCLAGTTLRRILGDGGFALSSGAVVRPRLAVGADGPRSQVGMAIGGANREFVATRQITVPLLRAHDATDIFLRTEYRGGYGWLFPLADRAHVGVGVELAGRERLKALLEDLHAGLAAAGRVAAAAPQRLTGGLIPVGGRVRCAGRLGGTPVLLAGDAAGLANPVTGSGIEAAVRSGTLAGSAAAAWLSGRAAAVDDYEEELAALYDDAFARALRRRRALGERYAAGGPDRSDLRRAWIAFAQYWSDAA